MGIAGKTSTMKGTILTVLVLLVASCQMKSTKHFLVETKTLTKDEPSGEDYYIRGGSIGGGNAGGYGGFGGHRNQIAGGAQSASGPYGVGPAGGNNQNNIDLGGFGGGYGNTITGGAQSAVGSSVGNMNSIG